MVILKFQQFKCHNYVYLKFFLFFEIFRIAQSQDEYCYFFIIIQFSLHLLIDNLY